jgi:hypothetical protein
VEDVVDGWHEWAAVLLARPAGDGDAVCALLDHAAVGLHHDPVASSDPGRMAMFAVDMAIGELLDEGVQPAVSATVDRQVEVRADEVHPLIQAAAVGLAAHPGVGDARLGYARAAVFVRHALDELVAPAGGRSCRRCL